MARRALAQSSWEGSPYEVRVWIALEPVPEIADAWQDRLPRLLQRTVRRGTGVTWNLQIDQAPRPLHRDMLADLDRLTVEAVGATDPAVLALDKLYLVAIESDQSAARIQVHELDCRTRLWGLTMTQRVPQPSRVGMAASRAVVKSFAPLARIEKVEDKHVRLRLRAGLLMRDRDSAAEFSPGALLRPIVCRNDRYGKLKPGGAQPLPWTVLEVDSQSDAHVTCTIHSGVARPLRVRRSRRVEQLAVGIRIRESSTRLRLVARSQPDRVLAGYDLFARNPASPRSTFVGRTNWEGIVEVIPGPTRLQVLYAKNGEEVLARLPLVPGEWKSVTAMLADDGPRLQAEGFLTALQERLVDLVTRRTILTRRIRQHIAEGHLDDGAKLVDELRALPSREELLRELRERKRSFATDDRRVRRKIDRLFDDLRIRLTKHLDPQEIESLRNELDKARVDA